MVEQQTKIYFPGLNGLRGVAAFLVLINHIELTKYHYGYPNGMDYPIINAIGSLSVTLFFVLSGFLITYLLLFEKENTGTIHVKKFYIKRVLRIWPVYFLVVVLGLVVLNKVVFFAVPGGSANVYEEIGIKWILYLAILPNAAAALYVNIPYLIHTWSIGVEEQFYIIWPWVIKYAQNYRRIFLIVIVSFILLAASLRFMINSLGETTTDQALVRSIGYMSTFISMFRINAMAIGGIGALILFYKKQEMLKVIYREDVQWTTFVLIVLLFLFNPAIKLVKHEVYSLLYCIVILNCASNPKNIFNLENKVFDFLGRISYGTYMYHPLAIGIVIGLLKCFDGFVIEGIPANILFYTIVMFTTFLLSTVSYYFFESKLLRWKESI